MMAGQIVEITKPGCSLNKSHGFLRVSENKRTIGQVPLDDISSVIIANPGCSISTSLVDHLCQRNIPVVICGTNFLPSSYILPVMGQGRQFQIMKAQTALTLPRRKRAWQNVVKVKISNQAQVILSVTGSNNKQLERLSATVRSGDPSNNEAQAARIYWPILFGSDFRRDKKNVGLNSALNYVYTIIRSCVARGVVGAGLHPTFSVHHRNPKNPFNLVDDLMEPFRPIGDYLVWSLGQEIVDELKPEIKTRIASITSVAVPLFENKNFVEDSPLSLASLKFCKSFADYCQGKESHLLFPGMPNPIDFSAQA